MHIMTRMLATTAIVLASGLPALAQDTPAADSTTSGQSTTQNQVGGQDAGQTQGTKAGTLGIYQMEPTDISASTFIGQRVYATRTMPEGNIQAGAEKDWDDIGEINDVVLSRDGAVKAVIVGVGGFLGLGEKSVALSMQDVKFVSQGDGGSDYVLVVNADKQMLTDLPSWESPDRMASDATGTQDDATGNQASNSTTSGTTMGQTSNDTSVNTTANTTNADGTDDTQTSSTSTTETRQPLERPQINREGYAAVESGTIKASDLEGATVYGPNDENVGEINTLVLDDSGQIKTVVLDVGGFLGMGEHRIGVTMDELNIVRSADNSDLRVYVNASEEALKAQPAWQDPTTNTMDGTNNGTTGDTGNDAAPATP